MTTETKRDVFEDAVFRAGKSLYLLHDADYAECILDGLRARYDAALPDNLPVIPKAVGEYIRKVKAPGKWGLLDVFWHLGDNISAVGINGLYDFQRWMVDNQLAIARAWLLGVWHIEETGEVVKLEAEK